jgi:hypothetical protein
MSRHRVSLTLQGTEVSLRETVLRGLLWIAPYVGPAVFVAGNLLAVTLTVDAPGSPEAVDTAVQIVERAMPAIPAIIRVIDVTSL